MVKGMNKRCPQSAQALTIYPRNSESLLSTLLAFSRKPGLGFLLVLAWGLLSSAARAQTNEWTWVGGASTIGQYGVYGTLQAPAGGNIPGARQEATAWTDKNGNFWLFGGSGYTSSSSAYVYGWLNDLWEFKPATKQWAWMGGNNYVLCPANPYCGNSGVYGTKGVPGTANTPGGRQSAVGWVDGNGNLWLFGGDGFDSAGNFVLLNDLWEFNTSTLQWTWMAGGSTAPKSGVLAGVYGTMGQPAPANTPGARLASDWTDPQGNLWLFGGFGYDSSGTEGILDDLWEFIPSSGEWTWVSGSNVTVDQPSVYGSLGVPATTNLPIGGGSMWTDTSGNIWMVDGSGVDSVGDGGDLNTVWEYSPFTSEWTWQGGSSTIPYSGTGASSGPEGFPGVYGTLGVPNPSNLPASRIGGVTGTGPDGNMWFFGGEGFDNADIGMYNDLWVFNPVDDEWAWMGGSSTTAGTSSGQPGIYGTLGLPAASNAPGARTSHVSWTDKQGNLWVFGGWGYATTSVTGLLNDLWEYVPSAPAFPPSFVLSASQGSVAVVNAGSGGSGTITITSTATGGFSSAIALAASGQPVGVSINFSSSSINGAGSATMTIEVGAGTALGTYPLTVTGTSGSIARTVTVTLVVSLPVPAAAPQFNPPAGAYATAQSVTITDATNGATIYYTTDQTVPTTNSTVYSGPITVSSSETVAAIAVAPGLPDSQVAAAQYIIGSTSTAGEWTWMGGSSTGNTRGAYGNLGVPAYGLTPGTRSGASSWTDSSGNFWLFGGNGYDANGNTGPMNDLWEYQSSSGKWVWMSGSSTLLCGSTGLCVGQPGVYGTMGIPAPGNAPGGRDYSASWSDSNGNFWLFGGNGEDSTGNLAELNDLWKYTPASNQWTWVGGSSTGVLSRYSSYGQPGVYGTLGVPAAENIPGGRYSSASWVDSQGNFWLFGGQGQDITGDSVLLNDMWEFNLSSAQWTWMGGSNVVNSNSQYGVAGVYGTQGVAAAANIPGSRWGAATWTDTSGNLWLFGGNDGIDSYENDLWKFNPSTNQWAWMSGASTAYCPANPLIGGYSECMSQPGQSGTLGVFAAGNTPQGGATPGSWIDQSGNFWLLGGTTSDITGENDGFYQGPVNSIWVFNPTINQWAWMGGDFRTSNCGYVPATPALPLAICGGPEDVSGTLQVPAVGNIPGARYGPATWTDKSGNFWLFSGGTTNDLWEYQPSVSTLPAAATPIFSLEPVTYSAGGPLMIANGMANAAIYYTTDGTTPTFASTPYTGPLTLASSETVKAIAIAAGYRNSAVASAVYAFEPTPPAPTFSVAPGTYTSAQTLTISDAAQGAYIYYTTDGTVPVQGSTVYSGPVTISSSETVNALAVLYGDSVTAGITDTTKGATPGPDASAAYVINQTATPVFSLAAGTYTSAQTVTISDATSGASIYFTTNGTTPTTSSTLYSGPISVAVTETIEAIAVSSGNGNSAIASATYTIQLPPSFTLTASPGSLTLNSGGQGMVTMTVTPQNGFNSAISFACSGLPSGASCSFNPTTITPSGTAATTTLTISAGTQAAALRHDSRLFAPVTVLAGLFCLFRWRRRCWWHGMVVVLAGIVAVGLVSGCSGGGSGGGGGGGGGGGSNPISATVTVTATSASLQQSATISVTIN